MHESEMNQDVYIGPYNENEVKYKLWIYTATSHVKIKPVRYEIMNAGKWKLVENKEVTKQLK